MKKRPPWRQVPARQPLHLYTVKFISAGGFSFNTMSNVYAGGCNKEMKRPAAPC